MSEDSASKMIIDNPKDHFGQVWESKVGPVNPQKINGSAVTISRAPETPNVAEQLKKLNEVGDAFMVGAAYGYALGNEVFNNDKNEFISIALAYLSAETKLIDKTPIGRSLRLRKIEALRNMDSYFDKRSEGYPLNKSYYARKNSYIKRAYDRWKSMTDTDSKPPMETFVQLTRNLILVREIISGKQISIEKNDLPDSSKPEIVSGYVEGFTKAFNYTAEDRQSEPDFKDKFWYLKEN